MLENGRVNKIVRSTRVNQESMLQVPCRVWNNAKRTKLLGKGYIYYNINGQHHIQVYGEVIPPDFYYLEPLDSQARMVVRARRKQ